SRCSSRSTWASWTWTRPTSSSSIACSAASPRSRPTAACRCSDEDREDHGHRRRAGRDLGADRGPVHIPPLHGGCDAGEAQRRRPRGRDGRPLHGAPAGRVGRGRRPGRDRGVRRAGRPCVDERHRNRPATALALAYDAPGGVLGAVADQVSKPMVTNNLERTLHNLKAEIEGGSDEVTEGMSIPGRVAYQLGSVKILVDAGVVRPMRPDRLLKFVQTLVRWGRSPAAGSIALADRFPNETAIVDELGTLTFSEVHSRSNAL